MAETIFLKTGQFSSSSFNTSKSDLKRAVDALNSLDYYGALWNATYTCNGSSQRIFTAAMIEEATALAILVEKLRGKLESYSKLLQSGPDALKDVDAGFKGEYTNAWQRTWYSISSGVSSVYETTVGFWGSLFHKGGKKTGDICVLSDNDSNTVPYKIIEESVQKTVNSSPTYKYWGVTEAEIADVTKSSKSEEEAHNKLEHALKEKLDAAVADGRRVDTTNYPNYTKYSYYDSKGIYREGWGAYEITGGCTWYAFNRFREMNNRDLVFQGAGGGNAKDWDDRIDTTQFEKISTSANCNGITNAIAVDNEGAPINGVYYGHVAYVEAIIGDTVYMSEGWYSGGAFHQTGLKTMTLSDFSNKYETLIVTK